MFKEGNGFALFRKMSWKRRYFVLKGHLLYYWTSAESYQEGKKNIKKAIELLDSRIELGEDTKFVLYAQLVGYNIYNHFNIIVSNGKIR